MHPYPEKLGIEINEFTKRESILIGLPTDRRSSLSQSLKGSMKGNRVNTNDPSPVPVVPGEKME